jgi:ABC-type molybdate transport system ATPase subunit
MLLGRLRIYPSPSTGIFPFLSPRSLGQWQDPSSYVSMVSFSHRQRSSGGAFYDYTARYGAVREEDRVTLRQTMFPDTAENTPNSENNFDDLAERLGLKALLDLPLVALSNGQTRRARILKALLCKPELLLLDEPLSESDLPRNDILGC